MNAARDLDPTPLDDTFDSADVDSTPTPVEPQPTLEELSPEAAGLIVRYIVTSTLEHGVAPTAVVALYADLAGEEAAVRYADRRFMLREIPPDWRDVENRVADLEASAFDRGLDLAAAWRRATSVAMHGQDALEQLARLAGVSRAGRGLGGPSDRFLTIPRTSTSWSPKTRTRRCMSVSATGCRSSSTWRSKRRRAFDASPSRSDWSMACRRSS